MNFEINRLINYGLQKKLFTVEDQEYVVNSLLDILQVEEYQEIIINEELSIANPILEAILEKVIQQGRIENTVNERDLFDTKVMNCLMPRPSEVICKFQQKYQQSPQVATDYFYDLSVSSNYIRKNRTDKNISFTRFNKYGNMEITINLSKPEMDPKDIAKAKLVKLNGYPKCLLCKENVGFKGNVKAPARQNHRIIPLQLDGQKYYLQYSPYVYYNEHCIVLNENHLPMVINTETFTHLLYFVTQFPHYMIGSNADLPIVGGSILSHDHYQGGNYIFPMEEAKIIKEVKLKAFPLCQVEMLKWPLSTIRITSESVEEIISLATLVLKQWQEYNDLEVNIQAYSGTQRHNTITPIARKKAGRFQMDLVLRNNRTSEEYPDGIFHPHTHLHHIKKENIGLIEVMGLAILPARLKEEMAMLEECLCGLKDIQEYPALQKHSQWYQELKNKYTFTKENSKDILEQEITIKFVEVLEDAGVFKMNAQGIQAFTKFINTLEDES